MLPDFPQIKEKALRTLGRRASATAPHDSLLSQVRHVCHYEGDRFGDGASEEHTYGHAESKFNIDRSELIRDGIAYFTTRMAASVADLTSQIEKNFFGEMRKVVHDHGNEVHVAAENITPEDLIAMLEKLEVNFDRQGRPLWPTIAINPINSQQVQICLEQLGSDPSYKKRLEALLEKKRAEWNSRESSRRLVD
jgi:hypothetical protein